MGTSRRSRTNKRNSSGLDSIDTQRGFKFAKIVAERLPEYTCFSHSLQDMQSRELIKGNASLRFMYYDKGQWKDYSREVTSAIITCFTAGKGPARFEKHGEHYMVDFLHMVQMNMQTGYLRSVAWMYNGKCYLPSDCMEGRMGELLIVRKQSSDSTLDGGLCQNSSFTGQCDGDFGAFAQLGDWLTKLADDDDEYNVIKEKFIAGLAFLEKHTTVTAVYKNSFVEVLGQVRLQRYEAQEQATQQARGHSNVQYAWHGTSKKGVCGIVRHGFGQPRAPKHGLSYGVGVYLAPEGCSHLSVLYSDVDESGEQHVLLCKVIMGRTEQVCLGSEQFHPSHEEYDTGVDDMTWPQRYIIWSTHMNTHILPQFVVSFKVEPTLRALILAGQGRRHLSRHPVPVCSQASWGVMPGSREASLPIKVEAASVSLSNNRNSDPCESKKACSCRHGGDQLTSVEHRKTPHSPWIAFKDLFCTIEPRLDSDTVLRLQQLYLEYQDKKVSRVSFVKMMRTLVGDDILRECITRNFSLQCRTEALRLDRDCGSNPELHLNGSQA